MNIPRRNFFKNLSSRKIVLYLPQCKKLNNNQITKRILIQTCASTVKFVPYFLVVYTQSQNYPKNPTSKNKNKNITYPETRNRRIQLHQVHTSCIKPCVKGCIKGQEIR